jgi:hypothetical protein
MAIPAAGGGLKPAALTQRHGRAQLVRDELRKAVSADRIFPIRLHLTRAGLKDEESASRAEFCLQ